MELVAVINKAVFPVGALGSEVGGVVFDIIGDERDLVKPSNELEVARLWNASGYRGKSLPTPSRERLIACLRPGGMATSADIVFHDHANPHMGGFRAGGICCDRGGDI